MIDMNKEYRTRGGSEVRIYSTEGGSIYPIHGAVYVSYDRVWSIASWTSDGRFRVLERDHKLDLIEVKPKVKYLKSIRQLLNEFSNSFFGESGMLYIHRDDDTYVDSIDTEYLRYFNGEARLAGVRWPKEFIEERDV